MQKGDCNQSSYSKKASAWKHICDLEIAMCEEYELED